MNEKRIATAPRRVMTALAGTLMGLMALGGGPEPAAARTGAGTTSSVCGRDCHTCGDLSCNCRFLPDGSLTCDLQCSTYRFCPNGVFGGGAIELDSRQATVALFATTKTENKNAQVTGLLRWVDPNFEGAALTLESVGLSGYGPVEENAPNTRLVSGWVLADGDGPFPFLLRVVAEPAGGADTLALTVGDAVEGLSETGFSYAAEGPLVSGDLVGTWTPPAQ